MIVKDFTNNNLPLLTGTDTAEKALQVMKEFRLENILVTINDQIGVVSYDNISLLPITTLLQSTSTFQHRITISTHDHIWEALRAFQQHDTCVLPVIDSKKKYVGGLSIWEISQRLYDIFPINNGGAILQMEIPYRNYSLSELANIIEGTNCKVTMLTVFPIKDSNNISLVFSIDKNDATETIQALDRHGYTVDSWFMNKGKIDSMMEERYSAFMKYINI